MFPIYICEDNPAQLSYLEKIINNYILIEELDMAIVCASTDPEKLLKIQKEIHDPGLYFLDIELNSHMDGFYLAEKIREKDPRGFIVFITTHSELVYISFEKQVEAMDYILKDQPERLPSRITFCMKKAMERYSSVENKVHKTLSVKIGSHNVFVPINDIYCIRSSNYKHKLLILLNQSVYECYGTLKEISKKLNDSFFLCHKSCIVNLQYISEIDKNNLSIKLKNGQICPFSVRSYSAMKKRLQEYLN